MRIGIDFDNTIAGYDAVFPAAARELELIPEDFEGGKREIRTAVRGQRDGEEKWRRLQGQVYGKYMDGAELIAGVDHFLMACRGRKESVFIISHKTEFGHHDPDRINLREKAKAWMSDRGFFDTKGFAIPPENVTFEDTRAKKIARIKALECSHFIDDLPEVFVEEGFPEGTRKYLLAPDGAPEGPFEPFATWKEIVRDIFGDNG